MKELWEQAILPYNLPLTIALGLMMVYWVVSTVSGLDFDAGGADLDLDADAEIEGDADGHGFLGGMMKFVNAQDVPVMMVLSLLVLFLWMLSITGNYYFNPEGSEFKAMVFVIVNFFVSVILVKLFTQPLRPFFRKLKSDDEHQEPLVGQAGVVKSRILDQNYGQVEVIRSGGAPALLSSYLVEDAEPLVRGDQVLVIDFDKEKRRFVVKSDQAAGTI